MPIGTGIVYNTGDLILSQVSSSGTAFLETKIAASTSSIIYFDNTARINSASLNSLTVGTASYFSGSTAIIGNLTASNISASSITASLLGTSSWATNVLTASFVSNAFLQGGNSFGTTATLGTNDNNGLTIETNNSTRAHFTNDGKFILGNSTTADSDLNLRDGKILSLGSLGGYHNIYLQRPLNAANGYHRLHFGTRWYWNETANLWTSSVSPNPDNSDWASIDIPSNYLSFYVGSVTGSTTSLTTSSYRESERLRITTTATLLYNSGSDTDLRIVTNDSLNDPKLTFYSSSTAMWAVGVDDSDSNKFKINQGSALASNNVITIDTLNNVGIGTTIPNSKLEVAGTSGTAIVSVTNTGNGRSGSFGIDSNGVYIQNSNNGDYFDLKNASGTSRFRVIYDNNTYINTTYTSIGSLTQSGSKLSVFGNLSVGSTTYGATAAPANGVIIEGNVGIGAINPSSKLDISGSTNITILDAYRNVASATNPLFYAIEANGSPGKTNVALFERLNNLAAANVSASSAGVRIREHSSNYALSVEDHSNNSLFVVKGDGKVGVGTSLPASSVVLTVATSSRITEGASSTGVLQFGLADTLVGYSSNIFNIRTWDGVGYYEALRTNGSSRYTLLAPTTGSVGIGTTNPAEKLDVAFNTDVSAVIGRAHVGYIGYNDWAGFSHVDQNSTSSYALLQNGSGLTILNSATGQSLYFRIGNSDKMLLSSSGDFGIGTTNPIAKLQVNGNISGSSFTSSISNAVGFLGTSSWAVNASSASFVSNAFVQGGNSFGTTATLGTNDANSLALETNGTARMTINSGGQVGIGISPVSYYKTYIVDTHVASQGSASLYVLTNQNQGSGATSANDAGIISYYNVNALTSNTLQQNQASYNQIAFNASGSYSGSYRAARNGILLGNTASFDTNANLINTYLTNQIGSSIPSFSINNFYAGDFVVVAETNPGTSTGSINNLIGYSINTPWSNGTAITTSNSYGAYIYAQKSGTNGVVNGWGIYQAGTSDLNIFAGKTRIGSTTSPVNALDVSGNISASVVTASLFFGTSSWANNVVSASYATTAQTANALNPNNNYTVSGLTADYVDVVGSGTIPTTGIYRPSTKTLGLSADGTLIFKISNVSAPATSSIETGNFLVSGSVGIGTTNPATKLSIAGADNKDSGPILVLHGNATNQTESGRIRFCENNPSASPFYQGGYIHYDGINNVFNIGVHNSSDALTASDTNAISIDRSSANVGIGTTSPVAKLQIGGNISGSSFTSSVSNAVGFLGTSSWATNAVTASSSLTASYLTPSNSYQITNLTASNISASGTIRALSLIETSTVEAKYNIIPLGSQLDKILQLNPVSFTYKHTNEPSIGLIAEEVGEIYPEFTTPNKDAVAYSKMVSVLIQSVKELKSIVDCQQKQINELLNK